MSSMPFSVRSAVSSTFVPVMLGFHAKACLAWTTSSLAGCATHRATGSRWRRPGGDAVPRPRIPGPRRRAPPPQRARGRAPRTRRARSKPAKTSAVASVRRATPRPDVEQSTIRERAMDETGALDAGDEHHHLRQARSVGTGWRSRQPIVGGDQGDGPAPTDRSRDVKIRRAMSSSVRPGVDLARHEPKMRPASARRARDNGPLRRASKRRAQSRDRGSSSGHALGKRACRIRCAPPRRQPARDRQRVPARHRDARVRRPRIGERSSLRRPVPHRPARHLDVVRDHEALAVGTHEERTAAVLGDAVDAVRGAAGQPGKCTVATRRRRRPAPARGPAWVRPAVFSSSSVIERGLHTD